MVTAVPEAVFVVISISVLFALAAIAVGVSIPSPSLVALLVDSDAVTPSSALLICVTAACIMARESAMPVIGTLNVDLFDHQREEGAGSINIAGACIAEGLGAGLGRQIATTQT